MHGNQLFDLTQGILKTLFSREIANLSKRQVEIIRKHAMMGGSKDGFRYNGVIYTELVGAARSRGKYDRIRPELEVAIGTLETERRMVENDRDRIKQALALTLRDTRTPQDIRDALPNCLKELVPECRGLERSRPEAYALRDNPRAYSQYMMLRDKIEFYVAAQLLY